MVARFSKCEMNNPEFTVIAVVIAARGTKNSLLLHVLWLMPLFLVIFFLNTKMGNDIRRFFYTRNAKYVFKCVFSDL